VSDYHLAQLNIAQLKYGFDDPELADFVARLEDINALADESPGLEEASDRLDCVRLEGPSPRAFTFQQIFAPG